MKVEIKNRFNGNILFSGEFESLRLTVEAAIKTSADLRSADLRSADLRYANLRYANLRSADLTSADLRSADLRYADLRYANLRYANLRSADLRYADLRSANLRSADLTSANLTSADLRSADLRSADLRHADLTSANLTSANLTSANLTSADLRSADLRSADLRSADLRYADLRYANLRSADLTSANLTSADLTSANLTSAKGLNRYLTSPLMMLNDQIGPIRAYKLVDKNGEGVHRGGVKYEIGQEVEETEINTDIEKGCAAGINLATLDWCLREYISGNGHGEGWRIFVAEFTTADQIIIPVNTDGKFRVRKCKIVGEKNLAELGINHKAVSE